MTPQVARRLPELVARTCPSCGTANPYTSFHCASCGRLTYRAKAGSGIDKFWVVVAVAVAVLAAVILLTARAR